MKPFRFSLEALRTLRLRQEHVAMEEYARTLVVRQNALDRLERVQTELSAGFDELRSLFHAHAPAVQLAQVHSYNRMLEAGRAQCAADVNEAERLANLALQKMLLAHQEREVVDACCNKQRARHQRASLQEEYKLLDDLIARRSAFAASLHDPQRTVFS